VSNPDCLLCQQGTIALMLTMPLLARTIQNLSSVYARGKAMKHKTKYCIGAVLYWLITWMPAGWWCTSRGWFWWAAPWIGYYAYSDWNEK
jgi:hypothetical protein